MSDLLSVSKTLNEKNSKTNISHTFFVPEGCEKIRVFYSYSPKTVEDEAHALKLVKDALKKYSCKESAEDFLPVSNLLTLSFDDPLGYRGACHRQPEKQEIEIGLESTPGIINRPVTAGEWKVTLNAHFIGCEVNYSLEIKGVEK